MRLLILMLLACAPHECEWDRDCPESHGWCVVPSTGCEGPTINVCREYHCEAICTCDLKKP